MKNKTTRAVLISITLVLFCVSIVLYVYMKHWKGKNKISPNRVVKFISRNKKLGEELSSIKLKNNNLEKDIASLKKSKEELEKQNDYLQRELDLYKNNHYKLPELGFAFEKQIKAFHEDLNGDGVQEKIEILEFIQPGELPKHRTRSKLICLYLNLVPVMYYHDAMYASYSLIDIDPAGKYKDIYAVGRAPDIPGESECVYNQIYRFENNECRELISGDIDIKADGSMIETQIYALRARSYTYVPVPIPIKIDPDGAFSEIEKSSYNCSNTYSVNRRFTLPSKEDPSKRVAFTKNINFLTTDLKGEFLVTNSKGEEAIWLDHDLDIKPLTGTIDRSMYNFIYSCIPEFYRP